MKSITAIELINILCSLSATITDIEIHNNNIRAIRCIHKHKKYRVTKDIFVERVTSVFLCSDSYSLNFEKIIKNIIS